MIDSRKRTERTKKEEASADIGILGGTGLYEIDGIRDIREVQLKTPFGMPSDAFITGTLEGKRVAFLSRHGRGHRILPSEINSRANVYGFKMLGVGRVISVNSVGSLREDIAPRDIVVADQFFDRTARPHTFFGDGVVAHVALAQPVCPELSGALYAAGKDLGLRIHSGGTYICIEGPGFSTVAESKIYRAWGCDVIGMTSATEAKLFREAEICYATLNLATDYDVWREGEESVSVELILGNLQANVAAAKAIIRKTLAGLSDSQPVSCGCGEALKNAIVTGPASIPDAAKKKLRLIIGKYIGE